MRILTNTKCTIKASFYGVFFVLNIIRAKSDYSGSTEVQPVEITEEPTLASSKTNFKSEN